MEMSTVAPMADTKDQSVVIDIPPIQQKQEGISAQHSPRAKTLSLEWKHMTYAIQVGSGKNKTMRPLLQGVNGKVKSGQVMAIMGASGAGKSTLLNVLAGRIGAGDLSGDVLVNGKPRNPVTWKSTAAYVEQDDLMYQNLTVRETLTCAAQLRLSSSYTDAQKKERVDTIIRQLALSKCENSRIGGPNKRGVSGGERKRVSIGIELVTEPKLIFLDEPTSGLDAFTYVILVALL